MGLKYSELSVLGRLRKVEKLGRPDNLSIALEALTYVRSVFYVRQAGRNLERCVSQRGFREGQEIPYLFQSESPQGEMIPRHRPLLTDGFR